MYAGTSKTRIRRRQALRGEKMHRGWVLQQEKEGDDQGSRLSPAVPHHSSLNPALRPPAPPPVLERTPQPR